MLHQRTLRLDVRPVALSRGARRRRVRARIRSSRTRVLVRSRPRARCVARSSRGTANSARSSARQACDAMHGPSWRSITFTRRRSAVRTPPPIPACSARRTIASPPNESLGVTMCSARFESRVYVGAEGRRNESDESSSSSVIHAWDKGLSLGVETRTSHQDRRRVRRPGGWRQLSHRGGPSTGDTASQSGVSQ